MRPAHIQHRINLQQSYTDEINEAYRAFSHVGVENITYNRVEIRLQNIKEQWEKFVVNNDAIHLAMSRLDPPDRDVLQQQPYFSNRLFATTQELYLNIVEDMTTMRDSHIPSTPGTSVASHADSPILLGNHQSRHSFHGPRLPRIDLPKFNGMLSEWLPFKDLFTSLVVQNSTVSQVEKMQYLKTSLIGSASHLLKNTPLTAGHFEQAWQSLISFYENRRLLVNSALQSLFSIKKMSKESASEIEHLYTSVMQVYRMLDTLQRPVNTWDDILVFMTVQRLDSDSIKAWEHHLGSSKEPPNWNQLKEFLMMRMLSLQAFEKSKIGSASNSKQRPTRSLFTSVDQNTEEESAKKASCALCSSDHYLAKCPTFQQKPIDERKGFVLSQRLCFNCLGYHRVANCRSTRRCNKCGHRHHTFLHQPKRTNSNEKPTTNMTIESTPRVSNPKQVNHVSHHCSNVTTTILLATAQINIRDKYGEMIQARALLDQGSETSLITENLAQRLRLSRKSITIPILGLGANKVITTRGMVSLILQPHYDSSTQIELSAHIVPKLTSSIPSIDISQNGWSHLNGLTFADPDYARSNQIDLIIGADLYGHLLEGSVIKGPAGAPVAQLTKLGWVISGPTNFSSNDTKLQTYHCLIDHDLNASLEKFWRQEEISSVTKRTLTSDDEECEKHFSTTHSRDNSGKYIVRLPFKQLIDKLGESEPHALRSIYYLQRKLKADPEYGEAYTSFMNEYKHLNHMTEVPPKIEHLKPSFYLPHHGVTRKVNSQSKLRVVFNGSCKTINGVSLNAVLHTGPKIQTNLFDVLIWIRQFKYIFSTDIEKMYRQIQVHQDDWRFQRVMWFDGDEIVKYHLTTVTYGLACAPFLALRAVTQLIKDNGNQFPLAAEILEKGRYVDDIYGGADSIAETQQQISQLKQLCLAGGFPLRKWTSNHPDLLHNVPSEHQSKISSLTINSDVVQALGLFWNPCSDTFHFQPSICFSLSEIPTKRLVLSTIAKLFDPMGFLSPLTVRAKMFMQELWAIQIQWDDTLPHQQAESWSIILEQFNNLKDVKVPRWIGLSSNSNKEIHGFCDASQQAMAASVYIKIIDTNQVFLLCSKTKVAPIKRMTIPRLELSAAVLLTKLVAYCLEVLKFLTIPCHLWTDSSIVLTWLNNHPSRWKDYVHNRVVFIQETLPNVNWRHVSGKNNPADCATRGLTSAALQNHTLWWEGPAWLKDEFSNWPVQHPSSHDNSLNLEERAVSNIINCHTVLKSPSWKFLNQYSSFIKLLRITAIVQLAVKRFRKEVEIVSTFPLTPDQIIKAKLFWIQAVQRQYFSKEIEALSTIGVLSKSQPIIRLLPFLDENRLLRVGGRLQNSSLPETTKHPYILPKESHLSLLIIQEAHKKTFHGSTQDTLSYIRNTFWIIGGRTPVRSFILKCVTCSRYRQSRAQQIMGQLPFSRVNPSRAFLHAGVDYAGPFILKTWRAKNPRTYKAWIALFVCQATSAIHMEIVTDYSTDAFIAAFKRFTARRGICATLTSDCGTNFKSADRELKKLFSETSDELKQLASLVSNDGTKWTFNPPAAPHFGGKWEAGVKAMKYHLKRVVGNSTLTYEEMSTLLTQIEAILNSRPLTPLTNDPDDLNVLTPGHFLIMQPLTVIPEPSLEMIKTPKLSRWQHICQMTQSFWNKWSKEYLQRHQAVYKWNKSTAPIREGTLVFIVDERYPPSKWPLGRVIKTHPGKDDKTRVVSVKTQTTTLLRPITKLCPLDVTTFPDDCSSTESTKAGGNV